jgi:hypothetical protein
VQNIVSRVLTVVEYVKLKNFQLVMSLFTALYGPCDNVLQERSYLSLHNPEGEMGKVTSEN